MTPIYSTTLSAAKLLSVWAGAGYRMDCWCHSGPYIQLALEAERVCATQRSNNVIGSGTPAVINKCVRLV